MIDRGGGDIDVLPKGETTLSGNYVVYFSIKRTPAVDIATEDKEIESGVLQPLEAVFAKAAAREHSKDEDNTLFKQLVRLGMGKHESRFLLYRAAFDMFGFPDHCAGAVLGPDNFAKGGQNALDLNNLFEIPVSAL